MPAKPTESYAGLMDERAGVVEARTSYNARRKQAKADLDALGSGPTGDGWEEWNWERRRVLREISELSSEYEGICIQIDRYNAKVDGMKAQAQMGKDGDHGSDS